MCRIVENFKNITNLTGLWETKFESDKTGLYGVKTVIYLIRNRYCLGITQ